MTKKKKRTKKSTKVIPLQSDIILQSEADRLQKQLDKINSKLINPNIDQDEVELSANENRIITVKSLYKDLIARKPNKEFNSQGLIMSNSSWQFMLKKLKGGEL